MFRKKIVFVVDISGSMQGKALDGVKNVLSTALSKLPPEDMFNIIAFNEDTRQFSESMEMATKDAVERALQWIEMNFVAGGGTDILLPLTKVSNLNSFPFILHADLFIVVDCQIEYVELSFLTPKALRCRICTSTVGSSIFTMWKTSPGNTHVRWWVADKASIRLGR